MNTLSQKTLSVLCALGLMLTCAGAALADDQQPMDNVTSGLSDVGHGVVAVISTPLAMVGNVASTVAGTVEIAGGLGGYMSQMMGSLCTGAADAAKAVSDNVSSSPAIPKLLQTNP